MLRIRVDINVPGGEFCGGCSSLFLSSGLGALASAYCGLTGEACERMKDGQHRKTSYCAKAIKAKEKE